MSDFPWYVAMRFLREGRMQTVLILVGVAVGVGVIVFLSALIGGLQQSLVRDTLGSQPHILVLPREDRPTPLVPGGSTAVLREEDRSTQRELALHEWPRVAQGIQGLSGVEVVTPVVNGAALARTGDVTKAVQLRGVILSEFSKIIPLEAKLKRGALRLDGKRALIGRELGDDLGLNPGDVIRLTSTSGTAEAFTVSGVFDLGNKEVNRRWVVMGLKNAQALLDLGDTVTSLEVRVSEVFAADDIAQQISRATWQRTESWMQTNQQLLQALRSQDASSQMIQTFVILAVALGIASVLVVSVVQKSREIGILRAMGTSVQRIRRIFVLQGGLLGLGGSVLGCLLGTLLSLFFSSISSNPDGTPRFALALTAGLFFRASLVATLTGTLAALFPARRAAGLDPAEVIRRG